MIMARYNRCEYDSCVYFKQSDEYICYYMWMICWLLQEIRHIQKRKAQLKKEFDMKDLGEAKKILGRDHLRKKYMQTLAILGELCS